VSDPAAARVRFVVVAWGRSEGLAACLDAIEAGAREAGIVGETVSLFKGQVWSRM
jgi:hypothetical protein